MSSRARVLPARRRSPWTRGLLEPEVREGLVGFRHPVHFLAFLDRAAAALGRFEELGGEPLPHRLLAALARRFADPAHRERHPAHRAHFDGNLEIRAAHAAALDLDGGPRVRERLVEDLERILAALLRDRLEGAVQDALGHRLLAGGHQHVDELRDIAAAVLRIGQDLALGNLSASGHRILESLAGSFAVRPPSLVASSGFTPPSVSWRRTSTAPACGP